MSERTRLWLSGWRMWQTSRFYHRWSSHHSRDLLFWVAVISCCSKCRVNLCRLTTDIWGRENEAKPEVKKQTKTQGSCCRRDTESTRKLLTVMQSLVWKKAPVQNPFITINPIFWGTTYSCTQSMATHHENFTVKEKPRSKIFRQASEEGKVDLLLPKKYSAVTR